jgi:hypothetical protein
VLALLPLIVVINATSDLYNRDELLLRKSTLDEIRGELHRRMGGSNTGGDATGPVVRQPVSRLTGDGAATARGRAASAPRTPSS